MIHMAIEIYSILKEDTDSPKQQLEQFFSKFIDFSLNNAANRGGCLMPNMTFGPAAFDPNVASRLEAYSLNTETIAVYVQWMMKCCKFHSACRSSAECSANIQRSFNFVSAQPRTMAMTVYHEAHNILWGYGLL